MFSVTLSLAVPTSAAFQPASLLQGLSVLVGLIEDNVAENGKLTGIGVECIWRVLELHGIGPLNHLCRLLANAGLSHRLMRAMFTLNQEYQILLSHAEVCLHCTAGGYQHSVAEGVGPRSIS